MKAHDDSQGPQHWETKRNSSGTKEGFEMKIASRIQNVKVSLLHGMKITVPAKLLGGLVLGVTLMTAIALSSGATYAAEPSQPLAKEEIRITRGGDIVPDDAWRMDAPFNETFVRLGGLEIQHTPDDAWRMDAPYTETFVGVGSLEYLDIPDDAWRMDAPYTETFVGVGSSEYLDIADDGWRLDAPFNETFGAQES